MTSDAQTPSGNFDIEITQNIDDVRDDWAKLEAGALSTPFQTQAWLLPFYELLAPALNASPLFILVREKSARRPVMFLPLCIRRHHGVKMIAFADLGVSDYNAPMFAPDFDLVASAWASLWRDILRGLKQGAILRLEKMPLLLGGRPNPLVANNPKARPMDLASWGVPLPTSFAEYDGRVLNQTFARELAKKNRRVAKRGAVDYALAQSPKEKSDVFDILARQRQVRCDEMGRSNILAEPAFRRFYEAVTVKSPALLASLGRLKVGEEIVATIFALNHRNAVHVLMSTYQGGEWKSSSLGNVVIQSAIAHAIGQKVTYFDLTIGNEGYKQHFGATPSPLYALMQPLTPVGAVVALMINVGGRIKKILKCILRRAPQAVEKSDHDG